MNDHKKQGPLQQKGIHIVHLNLQSLRNKLDQLNLYLNNSPINVLTFSESWLSSSIPDNMLDINGYTLYRNDRSWRENPQSDIKRGGGVGAYILSSYTIAESDLKYLNTSNKDIESLWIKLIMPKQKDIIIGTIYRPPMGDVKTCTKYLVDTITTITERHNAELFLLGDFNVNYLDTNSSSYKELKTLLHMTDLKQYIETPTRFNSLLDLAFSNSKHISQASTLDYNISDHSAILITRIDFSS